MSIVYFIGGPEDLVKRNVEIRRGQDYLVTAEPHRPHVPDYISGVLTDLTARITEHRYFLVPLDLVARNVLADTLDTFVAIHAEKRP